MRPVRFVAIVGGSGSGKTWLAERIAAALGGATARICLDDFYRDLSALPPEERAGVNFDDPAAIDWDCLRGVVDALNAGAPAEVPVYDFHTHTRRHGNRLQPPTPAVICEGLWLLHPLWLRAKFSLSVFVDCPEVERLRRRLERDCRERGRSESSVRRQFAEQVAPMHARFVLPEREWATRRVASPAPPQALEDLLRTVRDLVPVASPTSGNESPR
jgi:uridine kinase